MIWAGYTQAADSEGRLYYTAAQSILKVAWTAAALCVLAMARGFQWSLANASRLVYIHNSSLVANASEAPEASG